MRSNLACGDEAMVPDTSEGSQKAKEEGGGGILFLPKKRGSIEFSAVFWPAESGALSYLHPLASIHSHCST